MSHCVIGNRVHIKNGSCIGQDGFGWELAKSEIDSHKKKPQQLQVIIEDDVEIGANCTIDRGSWRDTIIRKGTKLDNQVQIAHNVQIGKNCVICAQSGIAGSVTVGNNVLMGGQVGIKDHITIGNNVKIAAKSGVLNHLESGKTYGGYPAILQKQFLRQVIHLKKLAKQKQIKSKQENLS